MKLLILSPDYASHYGPLAVLGRAARDAGHRVVVATGPALRPQVVADRFEWRPLRLGAGSNGGVAEADARVERFLDATRAGPLAAIRRQALDREHDLLWQPERVADSVARLCDDTEPDEVLVDHISFGATLGMVATGRPFLTLVPGHPSQLPVGRERYGIPTSWPSALAPDEHELRSVERLADRVTTAFTRRWNEAIARVAPELEPAVDAFGVHGRRVLYNAIESMHDPARSELLPGDHRFVGPLVRDEELPVALADWARRDGDRPQVYLALGTFLSHRGDVLHRLADALRHVGARAAIATGATPPGALGAVPADWCVAERLPQVAMLAHADVAIHHGGNNSLQEALAAGVGQVVLPFSTDQFANAADLERAGVGVVHPPNDVQIAPLVAAIERVLDLRRPEPIASPSRGELVDSLFSASSPQQNTGDLAGSGRR